MPYKVGIITVSDSCFRKEAEDKSGPSLCRMFTSDESGSWEIGPTAIVPDEVEQIAAAVKAWCRVGDSEEGPDTCDVVVTTGGTGLTPRDVTIKALSPLYTKPLPSFSIAMVVGSLKITPFAALSQVSCGIIGTTIVISVPGSRKGSIENLQQVLPILPHAVATAKAEGGSSRLLHTSTGISVGHHPRHKQQQQQQQPSPHRGCRCERDDGSGNDSIGTAVDKLTTDPSTAVARRHRKSPYPLIPFDDALRIVLEHTPVLPAQKLPVGLGLIGSVLAKDAVAVEDVPGYRASIVDGYAVISSDGPGTFKVVDASTAGDADRGDGQVEPLRPGQVARITTGAPLYPGADAVVMVEDTEVVEASPDGTREILVQINATVEPGESVREIGSDIKVGQVVLRAGDRISPVGGEIGTLIAAGIPRVTAYRRPRIGIFSTGDEVVNSLEPAPGDPCSSGSGINTVADASLPPLKPGQIRDTNRPSLLAAARGVGLDVIDLGIIKDDPRELELQLRRALDLCDVLVTTGGVSMGEKDWLKPVLEHKLNATIHFGRIRMKPAKPTTFVTIPSLPSVSGADAECKLLFALPGNPASAMVAFHLLVVPATKKLGGCPIDSNAEAAGLTKVQAVWVDGDITLDKVRPEFHRCRVSWEDGRFVARSTGGQRSSRIASMSYANGLVYFQQATETVISIPSGSTVNVYLIGPL